MIHTIDAQGKKIGRIATQAATILMGKHLPTFAKNKIDNAVKVTIVNTSKAAVDIKKKTDKKYVTFTGFRGGINTEDLGDLINRKGFSEAFKRAVYRMLPPNSLRNKRMKNLTITE